MTPIDGITTDSIFDKFKNQVDDIVKSKKKDDLGKYLTKNSVKYFIDFSRRHEDMWYDIMYDDIKLQISCRYNKNSFIKTLKYLYENADNEEFDFKKIPHFIAWNVKRNDDWDDELYSSDIYEFGKNFPEFLKNVEK